MSDHTFLPFARPTIDAETIAAVGAVLASGWITAIRAVRRAACACARQRHVDP
jgi:dTDP-4-amino-4,6-dideoxygalactose transaminase